MNANRAKTTPDEQIETFHYGYLDKIVEHLFDGLCLTCSMLGSGRFITAPNVEPNIVELVARLVSGSLNNREPPVIFISTILITVIVHIQDPYLQSTFILY